MNAGRLKLLQQEMRLRRMNKEKEPPKSETEYGEVQEESSSSSNESEEDEKMPTHRDAVEYIPGSAAAASYWITKDQYQRGRLSQSRETHMVLSARSKDMEASLDAAKKQLASRSASLRRAGRKIETQRLRIMQLEATVEKKTEKVHELTKELAPMVEEKPPLCLRHEVV